MANIYQQAEWLNRECTKLLNSEKLLYEDVQFLRKASTLRKLVGIPDIIFAQYRHNSRVKRYNKRLHQFMLAFKQLKEDANWYLDNQFNQQFDEQP